jgi:hypothetical protein
MQITKHALVLAFLAAPLAAPLHADVGAPYGEVEVVSAILDAGMAADQVRHLRAVPSVGVVNINFGFGSSLSTQGDKLTYFHSLVSQNFGGVQALRRALLANPVTRRAMAEHGVAAGQVDGVSIGASGSIRFIIQ